MVNINYKVMLSSLCMGVAMFACRDIKNNTVEEERISVKVAYVKSAPVQSDINAAGILSSESQSNLSFMTGGLIKKIYVKEGAYVRKGEVLAELDLTEISSRAEQTKIALDKSARDLLRVQALYNDSVATLETLQNAQTVMGIAETNFKIANFNLEYSKILAPGHGKILKKLKEVNEITAPGHPVFVFASTDSGWRVKISLSDRDIVKVKRNDSAHVHFDAWPGKYFRAVITELPGAANLLNGTYEFELKLLDLPDRLLTGLIGSVTIFPESKSCPLIPFVAIVKASGLKAQIFVVENDTAYIREVKVQAITDKGVYISTGLQEGEIVVTEGSSYLKDRVPVKVVNEILH